MEFNQVLFKGLTVLKGYICAVTSFLFSKNGPVSLDDHQNMLPTVFVGTISLAESGSSENSSQWSVY